MTLQTISLSAAECIKSTNLESPSLHILEQTLRNDKLASSCPTQPVRRSCQPHNLHASRSRAYPRQSPKALGLFDPSPVESPRSGSVGQNARHKTMREVRDMPWG